MIIIVGSRAANYWHPDTWPSPADEDYIAKYEDFKSWYEYNNKIGLIKYCYPIENGKKFYVERISGPIIEVEIAYPGTTAEEFIDKFEGHSSDDYHYYPTMDWLFALKTSHRFLKDSPHFEKTMRDYHKMKELGCIIPDQEWLKRREEETYNKPRPSLNRSKENFFVKNEGVQYIYDHDSIHEAMAILDAPAYKLYQNSDSQVMVSKKMWDECPLLIKLYGVLEESYVLALERSQIPYRGKIDRFESFKIALSKVCTSITSGWFREFAYEHYYQVLDLYSDDYISRFDNAVANGIVKPVAKDKAIA